MRFFATMCVCLGFGVMALFGAAAPKKKATPKKKTTAVRKAPVAARKRTTTVARRPVGRPAPRPTVMPAAVRATANDAVAQWLNVPGLMENPAALVPFFEQLYRLERGESKEVLRVFQYGDSHTAADEWSGTLRYLLQARFGDGGNGFRTPAGRGWGIAVWT